MAKVKRKSRTRQIVDRTVKQAARAISVAIETGVESMKRTVAVDHGDLESTIEGTDDGKGSGKIEVGGQSKISDKVVDYADEVEFGSVHTSSAGESFSIPAQPFFRPGIDDARRELKANMKIRG